MKLGLISSAWVGTTIGIERGIQLTKEIGFDSIDIFADPLDMTPQELRTTRATCLAVDLPVVSVVCCTLGIADFNGAVRRFHIERVRRFLELCYALHGKNVVLVLGEYIWNQEVIAPPDQWRWAIEGTAELGRYAQQLGLEIALELEPFALSLVNTVGKMDAFLAEVSQPNVKANVDISHLVLAQDSPASIERLRGRIAHAHLSDCDGKRHGDLPPGRGVIDFPPYLQALADTGFDGTVSIELEYSPEPDHIADWVREAYQSSSALMGNLQIRSEKRR